MFGLDDAAFGAATSLVTSVVDRIFPDKIAQAAERADFLLKAAAIDQQLAQAQIAVNQQEAASNSLFVAGWRPWIGWCGGMGFAYHLIIQPFFAFVMAACGHIFPLPVFDTATLNTVLMGLLGLGTMRTLEKIQGVK